MEDTAYQVSPSTATWIPPSEIDGEPHEVRDLSIQQLDEVARQISLLVKETVVQLRNAGITGRPGHTIEEKSLDTWLASAEGAACRELLISSKQLLLAARKLGQSTTTAA